MRPSRIVVVIDTLTLEGFDARQRRTIADALEHTLAQRFAADPARAYRRATADAWVAPPLQLDARGTPAALGVSLAQVVWRGVQQTQAPALARPQTQPPTPGRRR
jgi:hypothetical protein